MADKSENTKLATEESAAECGSGENFAGKVATIAVIGAAVALFEVELIPGMLLGIAAAFAPDLMPRLGETLRPVVKSTVRAGYSAVQKTREAFAEASEQVQDMVAEAKAEHEASTEGGPAPVV